MRTKHDKLYGIYTHELDLQEIEQIGGAIDTPTQVAGQLAIMTVGAAADAAMVAGAVALNPVIAGAFVFASIALTASWMYDHFS